MKKFILILASLTLALSLAACSGKSQTGSKETDNALEAFNSIVEKYPDKKGFHKVLKHWGFALPGGDKFEWTKDTSANPIDFAMVMVAEPFLKAGLDTDKLDSNYVFKPSEIEEGKKIPDLLIHPFNLNDKKETSQGSEDAFRRLLKADNDLVEYHKDLNHYRLFLNGGYEVQWTEELGMNNADMSFVIEADPLVKAGLDVTKLEGTGWIYKEAEKDDMGDHPNRLVKIYDIKK
ncbi:MAG: hypothetical protein K0R71_1707 [Bacillales bacterium]|nr:hypothetical protein [Bacillales bacterium]